MINSLRQKICTKVLLGHSSFHVLGEKNNILSIGEDCLLSGNQEFWAGDGHTILDSQGTILNHSTGITIGHHVWIGNRCTILGGTEIYNNSIVGAGSLVNKSFKESSIIIAGNPAKKIRENIYWDKESIALFK